MPDRAALIQGRPRMVQEARDLLRAEGWLANCPTGMQDGILDSAIIRTAAPGSEFVRGEEVRGGLFAIARGTAEISFPSGHPDTRVIHMVHAGFWGGYKCLIGKPRFLSLTARSDVLWALVPISTLERLLAENPAWWRSVLLMADSMIDTLTAAYGDSTRQDSHVRACATLLRLAGCRYEDPPPGLQPEVRLSQADLAAVAVMSRNTFNGIVGELVEKGHVELGYRSIRILNANALRAIILAEE
jgi:CRP/FNR family transcriptional regulator, cyclic AMP receptor protein